MQDLSQHKRKEINMLLTQVKPARSDPVRRKKLRSDPVGKLSDSE